MTQANVRMRWWIPLVAILAAWLLTLVACGAGRPLAELNPRPDSAVTQFVVGLSVFMPDTWPSSAYSRSSDLITDWPAYVVLATDGTGCLVSGEIMAMIHYGDRLLCVDGWRHPRPTH